MSYPLFYNTHTMCAVLWHRVWQAPDLFVVEYYRFRLLLKASSSSSETPSWRCFSSTSLAASRLLGAHAPNSLLLYGVRWNSQSRSSPRDLNRRIKLRVKLVFNFPIFIFQKNSKISYWWQVSCTSSALNQNLKVWKKDPKNRGMHHEINLEFEWWLKWANWFRNSKPFFRDDISRKNN
jgi:hypothetical protein